jgi:hypothetical protein
MGILDKLRGRKEDDDEAVVEPQVDLDARRPQLDELETALRTLARAMADVPGRMDNPGWRGLVEDYRWVASEVAHLSRREFARADLLDVVNLVRPLYPPDSVSPPAEYLPFEAEQARVLAAVHALRVPLPSES